MSTPDNALISSLSFATDSAIPSVSSPAFSNSVDAPRTRIEIVFNPVPTDDASCKTLFAAVIKPILCSRLLFAALKEEAEFSKPSNNPEVSIGSVFATWFATSTILVTSSACILNPRKVEIRPCDDDSCVILSPTF